MRERRATCGHWALRCGRCSSTTKTRRGHFRWNGTLTKWNEDNKDDSVLPDWLSLKEQFEESDGVFRKRFGEWLGQEKNRAAIPSIDLPDNKLGKFWTAVGSPCLAQEPRARPTAEALHHIFEKSSWDDFNWKVAVDLLRDEYKKLSLSLIEDMGAVSETEKHAMSQRSLGGSFVRLTIVKPERDDAKTAKAMDRREQHNLLTERPPILLKALFEKMETKRVLMQGRAGAGKSTAAKLVCHLWGLGFGAPKKDRHGEESWTPDFDAIILIELKRYRAELQNSRSWEEFLRVLLPHDMDVPNFWKWSRENPRVLWVIDGVDEVSSLLKSSSLKLDEKDFFGEARVLICTRAEGRTMVDHIDLCVEVEGFTRVDIGVYVAQYFELTDPLPNAVHPMTSFLSPEERKRLLRLRGFGTDASLVKPRQLETDRTKAAAQVLKLLESNLLVRDLARTPMNLELLCYAGTELVDQKSFALSKIYELVVEKIIRRILEDTPSGCEAVLTERNVSLAVSKAAWRTFQNDDKFLAKRTLEDVVSELGLSKEREGEAVALIEKCGPWKEAGGCYFWLHFTFQEYLAALYVCRFLESKIDGTLEMMEVLGKSFLDAKVLARGKVFYSFVSGIAASNLHHGNSKVVRSSLRKMLSASWVDTKFVNEFDAVPALVCAVLAADDTEDWFSALPQSTVKGQGDIRNTLLRRCAYEGYIQLCKFLLKHGAKASSKRQDGATALMAASWNGHAEVAKLLLNVNPKANVNAADKNGNTALMKACGNGRAQVVERLLNGKANVDAANNEVFTALMLASQNGHAQVVERLLNAKANVNAATKDDVTAFMLASQNGHAEVVERLLNAKANVNAAEKDCFSALILACQNGHAEVVERLLNAKADVSAVIKDGVTALMLASQNGHAQVVERLLNANPKADVNAVNKYGATALMAACRNAHAEVTDLLLNARADANMLFMGSMSALTIASQQGHLAVAKLLSDHGATPLCVQCHKRGNEQGTLLACSVCLVIKYCSTACQKRHWPEHKAHCRKII